MTKASKVCERIANYIKNDKEDIIVKAMVELEEYFHSWKKCIIWCQKNAIDELSTTLKPNEYEGFIAVKSTWDGNCLFNIASLLKSGNEEWCHILRTATAAELLLNEKSYVDHHALCTPAMLLRREKELLFPDLLTIESGQNEWYRTQNQAAAATIATPGKHVLLMAFLGLASVL